MRSFRTGVLRGWKVNKRYESNGHLIYQGDALNVLNNDIEDASVDLLFADPPYNIGKKFSSFHDKWPSDQDYAEWCYQWLELCLKKLSPNGSLYVMTSTQAMPYLDMFLRERMTILGRIIWSYDSSGVQAKKYYGSMYEPIIFGVKNAKNYTFNAAEIMVEAKTGSKRKLIDYRKAVPTPYNTKKVPGNVWEIPRVRYRMQEYEQHPTQKPETLLERIILASSNVGDTVLDPFAGSFSTGSVAKRLGRKSISIEREDDYIKIGLRRVLGFECLNGEELIPPTKTFQHKNTKAAMNAKNKTEDLFSVNSKA